MMLNERDYLELSAIVFNSEYNYPGYKPHIIESPNGDGYFDKDKKYAHINIDYLSSWDTNQYTQKQRLRDLIIKGTFEAIEIAIKLGIPKEFWPSYKKSTLRLLEYPPGAITHPHTDFDLFTLMLYRNIPDCFKYVDVEPMINNRLLLENAREFNHQIHFGELLEIINPQFKATKHEVIADEYHRTQYSIVFFAIPDHSAVLPTGQTVGEWIEERTARSRKEIK